MSADIFKGEIGFLGGSTTINNLMYFAHPEIAFIGRSNVGKSSLINAICYRKKLARTSKNPGATKQINFFNINNQGVLADLPGYGFANVSKKIMLSWRKLIIYYMESRSNLELVNILIDSKVGFKDCDIEAIEMMMYFRRRFAIVFTKVDKISKEQKDILHNVANTMLANCGEYNKILFTSLKSNEGVQELRWNIQQIIL